MYIDDDGETILDTLEEISAYANKRSNCVLCRADARMLEIALVGTDVVKVEFSTTCVHTINIRGLIELLSRQANDLAWLSVDERDPMRREQLSLASGRLQGVVVILKRLRDKI